MGKKKVEAKAARNRVLVRDGVRKLAQNVSAQDHNIKAPTPNHIVAQYTDKYCVTLDQAFTVAECQEMVRLTELMSYEKVMVNVGMGQPIIPDYRNSDRCIINSPELAEAIFQRVKAVVPATFKGRSLVGINERLRFLRYTKGGVFYKHLDGAHRRGPESGERAGELSFITILVYLNQGSVGGETRMFFRDDSVTIVPEEGKVLLFQHDILHEGSEVHDLVKYVLRSDVMYTEKPQGDGWEYSVRPIILPETGEAPPTVFLPLK